MAVSIDADEVAVAIRVATATDEIPAPAKMVLGYLFKAASALVLEFAPQAPDAMHDAAVIRLTGWLYDADPTDPQIGRAMQVSGAGPLLARWRVPRAGVITPGDAGTDIPAGAGLPELPAAGNWVLTVQDEELIWVKFPLPS